MGVCQSEPCLPPARSEIRTTLCQLGHPQPAPAEVQFWISQPGEVIIEQVRVGGTTLDYGWFSDWAISQIVWQIRGQLAAELAGSRAAAILTAEAAFPGVPA